MKVLAVIFADAIEERPDRTIDLVRAGVTHLYTPVFPAKCAVNLLVRLQLDRDDLSALHHLRLDAMLGDEPLLPDIDMPFAAVDPRQDPSYVNLLLHLEFPVAHPGTIQFVGRVDGFDMALPLTTLEVEQNMPTR